MLALKSDEQRRSPRYPLERLAKLEPANGGKPRFCLVTDMSDGGVRIQGFGEDKVPDEFLLSIPGDGPAQNGTYHVIWRIGSGVGAKLAVPAAPGA
jgi:hypothetical protein